MKKLLLLVAVVAMVLPGCKKIEESIDATNARIDKLEQETIPSIDEQIVAINVSLDALDAMDKELKGYIDGLQATADNLQEQINATNTKIGEVKAELQGEISAAKAEVLAELEALETELKNELAQINATIETLKAKDEELDKKIDDLKTYVDTELGKTADWVEATFATLEQYNALVKEVTAIKAQIEAINKSIKDLETKLTTKINEDIANAVASLSADIQQKVKEITDAYTNAIKSAKEDITAAYTKAIQNAINALDASLKSWVGEQLSNYYTIAEVDAKILALQTAIANGDSALQEELNNLKAQLETTKSEVTEAYKKAIKEAIETNNGIINDKITAEVLALNTRITDEVSAINERLAAIEKRLSDVEGKVATIEEQISSIQESINALEEVDKSLDESIKALEASDKATAEEIAALKDADKAIEAKIAELKKYVDDALKSSKDWVSTTFATLEQLNALSGEVAELKSLVDTNKTEAATNLANAISALETSLKSWVGEQLSNYYTIAEIDAKIAELQKAITDGDSALQQQLNDLKSQLETAKAELTEAYKKAIEEAINTNNGVIDTKIANEIVAVNKRIDEEVAAINAKIAAIEARLDALEDKVDDLEDKIDLSINFDIEEDAALIAGSSVKVNYTITNSDSECHIATIAQNGWSAVVTKSSDKEGYITVTSPKPFTNSPIIVLVSNSVTTIMRTLSFVDGFASVETDSYSVPFDATTLDINVQSNLDYTIEIPSSASSWISVKSVITRATLRNDVITLDIAENTDASARTATIGLLYDGTTVGSIEIYQQSQIIAKNEIAYTTTDNSVLTLSSVIAFGSKIVSHTYNNGRGLIVCESDIATIGTAFRGCSNLQTIKLPNSVTSIGDYAFYDCSSLTSITIPDSVTSIGNQAFDDCSSLTSITIPNSVTSIESSAFSGCSSLTSVTIGNSVTSIGLNAFSYCTSMKRVDISDLSAWCKISFGDSNANPLGKEAKLYLNGSKLTDITIPSDITKIRRYAFYKCTSLTSVTIPDSVTSIESSAFSGCSSLTSVYCKPTTPPTFGSSALPTDNASLTIYVPTDSVDAYKAASGWKDYAIFITEYVF